MARESEEHRVEAAENYTESTEGFTVETSQEESEAELDAVDIDVAENFPTLSLPEIRSAIEAILLIVDLPVSILDIATVLMVESTQVQEIILAWQQELTEKASGMQLRYIEGGWRLYTNPAYTTYIERFIQKGHRTKLSRAALETLAIIAYRQPVTRQEVASVRGVNVDAIMRALENRGLIAVVSDHVSSGVKTYGTTPKFLERLGLTDLGQLPPLAEFLPEKHHLEDIAQSLEN